MLVGVKCTERASPQTREMTAERLSSWPPESRSGFGHRLSTKCAAGLAFRLYPDVPQSSLRRSFHVLIND
jgi:hypothetical protein